MESFIFNAWIVFLFFFLGFFVFLGFPDTELESVKWSCFISILVDRKRGPVTLRPASIIILGLWR